MFRTPSNAARTPEFLEYPTILKGAKNAGSWLLLPVLSLAAFAHGQSVSQVQLSSVVRSMQKAQASIPLPSDITREYHLAPPGSIQPDSEVIAEVHFVPAPGKYMIQSHWGSGRAEYVVKNVLQHEIEISGSAKKQAGTALTEQNYDFQYLGTALLDGHPCFLLQLKPKRTEPGLVDGRIWVDKDSSLVRRVEGTLAKSPSWWVKTVDVDFTYSNFQGVWLQTNMSAVAEVRCFGKQQLTSRVIDLKGGAVAAKNGTRHHPTILAVEAH